VGDRGLPRHPTCTNLVSAQAHIVAAHGLTPPAFDHDLHVGRCLAQLRSKDQDIEKNIYLGQLKDADPHMFYRLILDHMAVSSHVYFVRTFISFIL
jgi:hypothetical protein